MGEQASEGEQDTGVLAMEALGKILELEARSPAAAALLRRNLRRLAPEELAERRVRLARIKDALDDIREHSSDLTET